MRRCCKIMAISSGRVFPRSLFARYDNIVVRTRPESAFASEFGIDSLGEIALKVPHKCGECTPGVVDENMKEIREEDKGVDFQPLAVKAKSAGKPSLDEFGDFLCGKEKEHLLLGAIGNEMNGVWKMHALSRHGLLLQQRVQPYIGKSEIMFPLSERYFE